MNAIKRVPKLLYIPFFTFYFIIIKLCNAEFQSGKHSNVYISVGKHLVAVIFSYKGRANYHEISEGCPNFCIPLYISIWMFHR